MREFLDARARATFFVTGHGALHRRRLGVGADAVAGDAEGGVGHAHADEWQVNSASVGIALVLATFIGLAGGYYVDPWLGTWPWVMIIGLGVGIAAGFVNLFRSTKDRR